MERKLITIILFIIIGTIVLECMNPPTSFSADSDDADPYSWIQDYRDVNYENLQIDPEKGLDLYDTKEENNAMILDANQELAHMKAISIEGALKSSLTTCTTDKDKKEGDYYIDLPKNSEDAKNAKIEIRYRSVRKIY